MLLMKGFEKIGRKVLLKGSDEFGRKVLLKGSDEFGRKVLLKGSKINNKTSVRKNVIDERGLMNLVERFCNLS